MLHPPGFEHRMTPQHQSLSIRISSDGLSFCTYAPAAAEPLAYKTWPLQPTISLAANLKDALLHEPLLQEDYQRVNVLISTPQFTVLPARDFDRDRVEEVYRFVLPDDGQAHVSYNLLRRAGIAIVFGLDRHVRQLLLDDFPRARFYAAASTLTEHFAALATAPGAGRRVLFAYLHEGTIARGVGQQDQELTLYALDQGRLLLINNYTVRGLGDCQYYMLGVWRGLAFDQVDDTLCIVDDNPTDAPTQLADKLRYFLHRVILIDKLTEFGATLTRGDQRIPYDLQSLLVCGF